MSWHVVVPIANKLANLPTNKFQKFQIFLKTRVIPLNISILSSSHNNLVIQPNNLATDIPYSNNLVLIYTQFTSKLLLVIPLNNSLVLFIPPHNNLVLVIPLNNSLVLVIPSNNKLVLVIPLNNNQLLVIARNNSLVLVIPLNNNPLLVIPRNILVLGIPHNNNLVLVIPHNNNLVLGILSLNNNIQDIHLPTLEQKMNHLLPTVPMTTTNNQLSIQMLKKG